MKKKTIRRSLSLLCSLALILSLAIPAFAADIDVIKQDGITITPSNEPLVVPRAVTWIELTHHTSYSNYKNSFTCADGEGNAVNVFVDNRQGNGDVYMTFTVDGSVFPSNKFILAQGEQGTYRIQKDDKTDMGGIRIEIEIGCNDGHEMNLYIKARQFDYVASF